MASKTATKKPAARKAAAPAKETKPAAKASGSKAVRFISKYNELRLVREPAYTETVNGRAVPHAGTSIQFHDGVFESSDAAEVAFLRDHANLGSAFVEVEDKTSNAAARADYVKTLEERNAELEAELAATRTAKGKLPRADRRDEVKTHAGRAGSESTTEDVDVENTKSLQADPSVNPDAPAFDDEDEAE